MFVKAVWMTRSMNRYLVAVLLAALTLSLPGCLRRGFPSSHPFADSPDRLNRIVRISCSRRNSDTYRFTTHSVVMGKGRVKRQLMRYSRAAKVLRGPPETDVGK